MKIHFLFIGEGSSDRGLVPHLESLCVRAGAEEATGVAPDLGRLPKPPGKDVASQVGRALRLEPTANLVFVHRDSDSRDPSARRQQIMTALSNLGRSHVPVVPVQELEAWLLLDEGALRTVAGNPGGRQPLGLPRASHIEDVAAPKERLMAALETASGLSGRRLDKFKQRFSRHRAILLERLDIEGLLSEVPAWKTLVQDIVDALAALPS
jgi:hypothetical protein